MKNSNKLMNILCFLVFIVSYAFCLKHTNDDLNVSFLIFYCIRNFQYLPSSGSRGDTSHVFAAPFGVFLCCLCPSINGDSSGHSKRIKI